jgi:hypothetical protein
MKTSGNTIFIADATSGRGSVPVLLMTGAADPISSHDGAEVSLFGFQSRGRVLSANEAARFFLHVTGSSPPRTLTTRDNLAYWNPLSGRLTE